MSVGWLLFWVFIGIPAIVTVLGLVGGLIASVFDPKERR